MYLGLKALVHRDFYCLAVDKTIRSGMISRKFDDAVLHRDAAKRDFLLVPPASHHDLTKAVKASRVTLIDPIAVEGGNMEWS